ncbi:ubiquitin carboxyl-terminal hydrolase 17-like, partial [Exaiptasia diaphana]|uniref:ubiquitinyl hydrolase 1 n=1 Tax=Exaiptasia diaphana TaxID=2652724 RepID=A0A913YN73_EXADI
MSIMGAIETCTQKNGLSSLLIEIGGESTSSVRCSACGHTSYCITPMYDCSIDIPTSCKSLEYALKSYFATEILDGSNKYLCTRCGTRTRAEKKISVTELPKVHFK